MNIKLKYYLFIIGVLYALGAVLHILDVLDLRLEFTSMNTAW
jgi:hypothetical protein